ncbi:type III secretion system export apparatus subunit SctV [Acetobacter sacchari]|uniref:Type III secretion system export apparatus subunit SctV n=1 Tax=Acetobacter sacchari TaxID=2661687 RepID=A0ABS3LWY8_9PROT|nr:type III secretion system export apparatus subunit SctV [Acetobacter sacchari]MBO1360433.1 type III secretion system export apparatus subunit SctV [Acetobacter sacchari]
MKPILDFFRTVSGRQDLALVAVLVLTVAMLIMPMPAALADILIGCNLSLSVLLLMVAVYLKSPLDLTSLPGIILVSTVFRLALEVTVTRFILTTGDAGSIVETFGELVIGGNVVVGLVVFAIVTTVQFIVVTKGTERVAEVGARFTLDAMPGKQMAIDSDVRSGDIDQTEARRRRQEIDSESALHGAMDGALKFVKGDAIAGLIIIIVNLVGGISIGMGQNGMSARQAMQTYTLLTVGDALVAHIPALLLSITAAIVVTRVGGHGLDVGRAMVGQLTASRRALAVASGTLLCMALVPGFPKPVFLCLALAFFLGSRPDWWKLRQYFHADKVKSKTETYCDNIVETRTIDPMSPHMVTPLVAVTLAEKLYSSLDITRLERYLAITSGEIEAELGLFCPKPYIRVGHAGADTRFSIDLEDVPAEEHDLKPDYLLLHDDPVHLDLVGVEGESGLPLLSNEQSVWIAKTHEARLRSAGIGYLDAVGAIAYRFRMELRKNAYRLIGLQETKRIIQRLEPDYEDLVREATRIVPIQRISDILRRLAEEGVSLKNTRLILETLIEWGENENRSLMLVEHVRHALSRQFCHHYAGSQKAISALVVTQDTEQILRQALRETQGGTYLALDADMSQKLLHIFRKNYKLKKMMNI